MDYHIDDVPHVVAACVVLHNICEIIIGEDRGLIIKRELLQALVLPPPVLLEMLLLITSLHCNLYFHTARSLLLQYYSSEML